jgi:L-malate glycosyltransferase
MLRQIFQQGGVEERVHFPGQVSQADLPRYYRSTDLYLSASHSDGTSISLLEALACGRPALISDIPGNREWITPEVEGWLFPDGDAVALSEAIEQAASDRLRLVQMGEAARRLAEQRADWDKNFPQLFRAYGLALSKSS